MTTLWSGVVQKMRVDAQDTVSYALIDATLDATEPDRLALNERIGERLILRFDGQKSCVLCGRSVRKLYNQGACYPCLTTRPETDGCIVRPHECHFFEPDNPCRDEEFAFARCFQPHVLYVALTSGPKVGITRQTQVPTRWMDQGATEAIIVARMGSRREIGLAEHALAGEFADRTDWRRMLRGDAAQVNLTEFADQVSQRLTELGLGVPLPSAQREHYRFSYPSSGAPEPLVSIKLDKTPEFQGQLMGIKGQYLLFDTGVINLRSHSGFHVEIDAV
jgi:hypothetical protein